MNFAVRRSGAARVSFVSSCRGLLSFGGGATRQHVNRSIQNREILDPLHPVNNLRNSES